MKGVILAGGSGTRLKPLTKVTNKQLLPVYDRPMIFYPIQTLITAGIKKILILTSAEYIEDFRSLIESSDFEAEFSYKVQEGGALGLAHGLGQARDFVKNDKVAMILGDNIFEDDFSEEVQSFELGARLFLSEVSDPERFGVAELNEDKVVSLEEKPLKPKSNFAATGLYIYDNEVFSVIDSIDFSARGELEITDVNKVYLERGLLSATKIKGSWTDAGTFESLYRASTLMRDKALREAREHKSGLLKKDSMLSVKPLVKANA